MDKTNIDAEPAAIFDVKMEDKDVLQLIREPITKSEAYWNNTFGLAKVRESNKNLWLPLHYKDKDVYDYQEEYMYQDNRIFSSIETIVSMINTRIAQPEVTPAQDTITSLQIAKDLSKALFAHAEKYQVDDIFRVAARNLLLSRVGWVKLRWDIHAGENGDAVPEHVPPEDMIVDMDAKWNEVPRFIGQRIHNKTGDDLVALYPEKEQEIYKMLGVARFNSKGDLVAYKSQLAKKVELIEVWFTYFDAEAGTYAGAVCVVDDKFQTVLDKQKNPNWNYEDKMPAEGEEVGSEGKKDDDVRSINFLDRPEPPFFNLNYLNDGSSFIDQTSMVEQAAPLQHILDRRGFQIMENAEMSGSGMVFNTNMITKEDIAKLVGAPDEKVGVKGDVRSAFMRIPPPPLPNYVIEDKMDARQAMDNIFATHEITRGESSANKTLGQDKMQFQQNATRMNDIARSIERMATRYYRYLVQMMKVYYTEEHYFKAAGEDGQFDFVVMKGDLIEDGIDIRVEAGSTMPIDRETQLKWSETLMGGGLIDPLSLYEVASGGSLPSPKKMLERFMLYKTDPLAFMGKVQDDDFDRQAFLDIQILNGGKMPEPRSEYNAVYFKFINNYMLSGDFEEQVPYVKELYLQHLQIAQMQAQKQLELMMTQMPTQEDMDAKNQKEMEQAQMGQQLNPQEQQQPGKPGQPQPGQAPPPKPAPKPMM